MNIMQKIESGDSIHNLPAFLKLEANCGTTIYVPIVVLGFNVSDKSCGITLSVQIVAKGIETQTLRVTPCQIFISKEEIQYAQERKEVLDEVYRQKSAICRWGLHRRRIETFATWVAEHDMSNKLSIELEGLGHTSINKITTQDLDKLARDLFIDYYKLTEDEIDEIHWRFN
jgi:hypothetical protein